MKKIISILLISLIPVSAFAQYKVITSDEGQQVVLDDNRRLTVFMDEPIDIGDPICVYLDTSELDTRGYDKVEWYYLREYGLNEVLIQMKSSELRLPTFVNVNEKVSILSVPLTADPKRSGTFIVHGVEIKVTIEQSGHISAEIVN
ncbi:MAG: hypothetical protein U9R44_03415 [Candidatus Omnitrophota bacterium]|nr:hypothetical protein [Candidatus Omnitrophota bacterium]